MIDPKKFEELAKKICDKLPKGFSDAKSDMQATVKSVLQTTFDKLDLVTRKEFEVQIKLLNKCRERIKNLEDKLSELEKHKTKKH